MLVSLQFHRVHDVGWSRCHQGEQSSVLFECDNHLCERQVLQCHWHFHLPLSRCVGRFSQWSGTGADSTNPKVTVEHTEIGVGMAESQAHGPSVMFRVEFVYSSSGAIRRKAQDDNFIATYRCRTTSKGVRVVADGVPLVARPLSFPQQPPNTYTVPPHSTAVPLLRAVGASGNLSHKRLRKSNRSHEARATPSGEQPPNTYKLPSYGARPDSLRGCRVGGMWLYAGDSESQYRKMSV